MKLLRRAAPTPPPPPVPKGDEAPTRRRVEVIVEREWARESITENPIQRPGFETYCITCGRSVPMLNPAAAAILAQVTVRIIYRWVDEKKLHFIESPAGDLYLCANSIPVPHQTSQLPSGDPR